MHVLVTIYETRYLSLLLCNHVISGAVDGSASIVKSTPEDVRAKVLDKNREWRN